MTSGVPRSVTRRSRDEREALVLDTAGELFYARGVHEVGMDELVQACGLAKASVYRLYPTKDRLIGAYLERLADRILTAIDDERRQHAGDPAAAIRAIFAAVLTDIARTEFRGCAFNNASIEFADPDHPARVVAREYRAALYARLVELATELHPECGERLGGQLAVLIDGMYTSAAHLGADGPASTAIELVEVLLSRGR